MICAPNAGNHVRTLDAHPAHGNGGALAAAQRSRLKFRKCLTAARMRRLNRTPGMGQVILVWTPGRQRPLDSR